MDRASGIAAGPRGRGVRRRRRCCDCALHRGAFTRTGKYGVSDDRPRLEQHSTAGAGNSARDGAGGANGTDRESGAGERCCAGAAPGSVATWRRARYGASDDGRLHHRRKQRSACNAPFRRRAAGGDCGGADGTGGRWTRSGTRPRRRPRDLFPSAHFCARRVRVSCSSAILRRAWRRPDSAVRGSASARLRTVERFPDCLHGRIALARPPLPLTLAPSRWRSRDQATVCSLASGVTSNSPSR